MSLIIDKFYKVKVLLEAEITLPADSTKEVKDYIHMNLVNNLLLNLDADDTRTITLNVKRMTRPELLVKEGGGNDSQ